MNLFIKSYINLRLVLFLLGLSACQQSALPNTITPAAYPSPSNTASQPTQTVAPAILSTHPTGADRIAATIPLSRPSNMVVENGNLWVISGSSVIQIDPKSNRVIGRPITAGIQYEGDIAFSGDTLWASTVSSGDLGVENNRDAVKRVNLETGEVTASVQVPRGPVSLSATPGKIWVVNFGGTGDSIMQIDTQTNQIVGEAIKTGLAPISIAVGVDSLWVANHDAGTVTRINPDTGTVLADIDVPSEPHRITYGEKYVWVSNWHDNSVTQIDPATNQLVGEPIDIGFPAGNIAAGLGSVWVTSDYRADGKTSDVVLVRIDVETRQVIETIAVGGHPIDVALTDEAVWVTVQHPDMIVRINP